MGLLYVLYWFISFRRLILPGTEKTLLFSSIGASWVAFIAWEVFEGVYFYLNPLGTIQNNAWDTMIDLWVDILGTLSICFLCDELVE
jgi:hypothetical protein